MSTSRPDVSVVIVSWNVRDLLRNCLRSIIDKTHADYEIIVVDNASHDGSSDMVAEEFPDVRLIANDENRGFAAANNQGLKVANGQNLLLLNPDTVILDCAIDTMLEWLDRHTDVGCVGCQVRKTRTEIQMTCFADPRPLNIFLIETGIHRLFPGSRLLGSPEYAGWDRTDERDVDVVSGMVMLLPRHVVEEVGFMDEAFFVYTEEADWCRRIRDAGYRCVFSPAAQIMHLDGGSKSTAQIRPRMYVQLQKSKMIYVNKHYGPLGRASVKLTFLGSMTTRALLFGSLALISPHSDTLVRARLAWAAVRFHLTDEEPKP